MRTSKKGLDFIKSYEECKLYAYRDAVGVWTIGWGNTSHAKSGMIITQEQANKFFEEDIQPIEKELNKLGINFKQNQFDALCSFIFNLGISKFNNSTMKRYILAKKEDIDITDQMVRWHNAGGKPLLGLKRRRVSEANMFLGYTKYYIDNKALIRKK